MFNYILYLAFFLPVCYNDFMEHKKKEEEFPICDPMICKLILLFTLEKMEMNVPEGNVITRGFNRILNSFKNIF